MLCQMIRITKKQVYFKTKLLGWSFQLPYNTDKFGKVFASISQASSAMQLDLFYNLGISWNKVGKYYIIFVNLWY